MSHEVLFRRRSFCWTLLILLVSTLMMIPIFDSASPSVPCSIVKTGYLPSHTGTVRPAVLADGLNSLNGHSTYRCRLLPGQDHYIVEPAEVFLLELLKYTAIYISFICLGFWRLHHHCPELFH